MTTTVPAGTCSKQYLTPEELSARFRGKITIRTLANWRCQGVGPKFHRLGGRILYSIADVLKWEESSASSSTGGYRAQA